MDRKYFNDEIRIFAFLLAKIRQCIESTNEQKTMGMLEVSAAAVFPSQNAKTILISPNKSKEKYVIIFKAFVK